MVFSRLLPAGNMVPSATLEERPAGALCVPRVLRVLVNGILRLLLHLCVFGGWVCMSSTLLCYSRHCDSDVSRKYQATCPKKQMTGNDGLRTVSQLFGVLGAPCEKTNIEGKAARTGAREIAG